MTREQPWAGDTIPEGTGVIEVRVAELRQFFNSMDPSPFREKDLDEAAVEFIVSWAKEYPADQPLALLIHLDEPAVMPDAAEIVRDAVHAFFARSSAMSKQRLRQLLRIGRTSLIIGLVFLAVCLLLGDWIVRLLPVSRLAAVLRESLVIGGWVAMWRPLQIFLYDWWPIRNERRIYDRLSRMLVRIVCTGASGSDGPYSPGRDTSRHAVIPAGSG